MAKHCVEHRLCCARSICTVGLTVLKRLAQPGCTGVLALTACLAGSFQHCQ
jgi:hypothetical protein